MTTPSTTWKEIRELWRLAMPVTLSQLAIMGIWITDVVFAGRSGTNQLAGVTLGANVWNMIAYFFFAVGLSAQILVGRHFGANQPQAIRKQIQQSLWAAFFCGLVAMLLIALGVQILGMIPFQPEVQSIGRGYLAVMILAAMPMALMPVLRTSIEAMNQTRGVMLINVSAFLINIPLDYALVFGRWGFPALGGVGCAMASVVMYWCVIFAFYFMLRSHPANRHLEVFRQFPRPDWPHIFKTLRLGFPIGLSVLIELAFFAGAGVLITLFGAVAASAHSVAISTASLAFMVYMGLGQGVTIRASQYLGAGRPDLARYSARTGLYLTFGLASLISLILILFRDQIPALFSNDPEVVGLAAALLLWAAIFQLADAAQICAVSGLRAYKDTYSAPRYQFAAFWVVAFPLALGLAYFSLWPNLAGPAGYWVAMVVGLVIAALLLIKRLNQVSLLEMQGGASNS